MKTKTHSASTESRASANEISRNGNKSFPAQAIAQKKENEGGLQKGKAYFFAEATGAEPDLSKPSHPKDKQPHPPGKKGLVQATSQLKANGSSVIQRAPVINYIPATYVGNVNDLPTCAAYLTASYGHLPATDTLTITHGLHTGHEARSYYGPPDPVTGVSPVITSLFVVEYFDYRYNGGDIIHHYTGNMVLAV